MTSSQILLPGRTLQPPLRCLRYCRTRCLASFAKVSTGVDLHPPSWRPVDLRPPVDIYPDLRPPSWRPVDLRPPVDIYPDLRPPSWRPVDLRPPSWRPVDLRPPSWRPVGLRPLSWRSSFMHISQVSCTNHHNRSYHVSPAMDYHTSFSTHFPDKKAKVEKAVDTMKEKKKKEPSDTPSKVTEVVAVKPSLPQRAWETVLHFYHGFRLLALDTRVAVRLLWKTMKGSSLTRREQKQFRRTAGDIFRVVPFSVFVIIPFMEFLLPVYLWFFPNALPSTFQSSSSKEMKKKKQLKLKIQMAKFLQDTIEDMAVSSKNPSKNDGAVAEFAQFFDKIRTSGEQASTEELVKFSQLFEDELTLDNLSRPQLTALCKLLLLQTIGTSNFLRFQLRMKLRQLQADDLLIQKETVDSLTEAELQSASQARGMMALGMPAERLKSQLEQWLDLHLVKKVPASLLLLSRALYLPDDTPPSDALRATLSTLPESIVDEAEVLVADTSGENVDNKTRLDLIRQQEQFIKKEAEEKELEKKEQEKKEQEAQRASEELVDTAPVLSTSQAPPTKPEETGEGLDEQVSISVEELKELNQVVQSLKVDQDRTQLEELKEDREEYIEDVADLVEECEDEISESKGSARLGRRVDAMLSKIDLTLQGLEPEGNTTLHEMREERNDVISTAMLEKALEALKGLSGEAKTRSIVAVLDEDHDGNINLDEIAEVIESLALEDTDIKPEHIEQIKELIKKEVVLEEEITSTLDKKQV